MTDDVNSNAPDGAEDFKWSDESENNQNRTVVQGVVDKFSSGLIFMGEVNNGLESAVGDTELMGMMVDAWISYFERNGKTPEKSRETVTEYIMMGASYRGTSDQWSEVLRSRGCKPDLRDQLGREE